MNDTPEGITLEPTSLQSIIDFCADENRFNIIVMAQRPCINWYCVKLEYENFVPDTPENDEFQFFKIHWMDMDWFVISIPAEKREIAERVAEETSMKLSDGIPI